MLKLGNRRIVGINGVRFWDKPFLLKTETYKLICFDTFFLSFPSSGKRD